MHKPVLLKEVLEYLDVKHNRNYIDCTVGQGGHALAILEKNNPVGKVLGIDLDKEQIRNCIKSERLIAENDNYSNLKSIVERLNFKPVHGILLDLGMSTWHIEEADRGFSFLRDETLDMRYNYEIPNPKSQIPNKFQNSKFKIQNNLITAEYIVNNYKEEDLERILKEYGEERFAKKIAREIVRARKVKEIKTTFQLIEIIKKAVPFFYQRQKISHTNPAFKGMLRDKHFATKTFQALRIEANQELENLKAVLPQIPDILEKEGRLVIISFHSLEDRIVKNFLKDSKLKILTKKPITASLEELKNNLKSRSAKLRAAEKI